MIRKGKWSAEEEKYASRIIHYFSLGMLPIKAGTTLRSHLSEKLNCDPMRITKKFAGASCIGKQVFTPCPRDVRQESILACSSELDELEADFLRSAMNEANPYSDLPNMFSSRRHNSQSNFSSNSSRSDSTRKNKSDISSRLRTKRRLTVESPSLLTSDDDRRYVKSIRQSRYEYDGEMSSYVGNLMAAGDLLVAFSTKMKAECVKEGLLFGIDNMKVDQKLMTNALTTADDTTFATTTSHSEVDTDSGSMGSINSCHALSSLVKSEGDGDRVRDGNSSSDSTEEYTDDEEELKRSARKVKTFVQNDSTIFAMTGDAVEMF
jgi:hypothetical protein